MAREPARGAYLFLDVDGVLNPECRRLTGFGDWAQHRVGGWRVWSSRSLGAWLSGLIDTGVQIVWATTWVQDPKELSQLAEHFGLSTDLPCIDALEWPDGSDMWDHCGKGPGVLRWLAANDIDPRVTPVVWVDDCLTAQDHLLAEATGIVPVRVPAEFGLDDAAQRRFITSQLTLDDCVGSLPRAVSLIR